MSEDKPRHRAWFQSLRRADERYPLDEVIYTDRDGGLLQVAHDMAALARTPAAAWKQLFEDRAHKTEWPYGSGVWGKKEWVAPHVADDNVVSLLEGGTNLFWADRYGEVVDRFGVPWEINCRKPHGGNA